MAPPPGTEFSKGWAAWQSFVHRSAAWEKHVVPVLKGKAVCWLELGSYEGRSAIWTLSNALTHPSSTITCVDMWGNSASERRFDANLAAVHETARVVKIKSHWHQALRQLQGARFAGAYIDADHRAASVLTQSVLIWPLIEPGGIVIWDDYELRPDSEGVIPVRTGVDAFLAAFEGKYQMLYKGWQVIVCKVADT